MTIDAENFKNAISIQFSMFILLSEMPYMTLSICSPYKVNSILNRFVLLSHNGNTMVSQAAAANTYYRYTGLVGLDYAC